MVLCVHVVAPLIDLHQGLLNGGDRFLQVGSPLHRDPAAGGPGDIRMSMQRTADLNEAIASIQKAMMQINEWSDNMNAQNLTDCTIGQHQGGARRKDHQLLSE